MNAFISASLVTMILLMLSFYNAHTCRIITIMHTWCGSTQNCVGIGICGRGPSDRWHSCTFPVCVSRPFWRTVPLYRRVSWMWMKNNDDVCTNYNNNNYTDDGMMMMVRPDRFYYTHTLQSLKGAMRWRMVLTRI